MAASSALSRRKRFAWACLAVVRGRGGLDADPSVAGIGMETCFAMLLGARLPGIVDHVIHRAAVLPGEPEADHVGEADAGGLGDLDRVVQARHRVTEVAVDAQAGSAVV